MMRRGFTIVELIITITIMGILLTLAVLNLSASQVNARDDERRTDIETISLSLEGYYNNDSSNTNPSNQQLIGSGGSYPGTNLITSTFTTVIPDIDPKAIRAPGIATTSPMSLIPATNEVQTAAGVTPLPTLSTYVYQPLSNVNTLCTDLTTAVGKCVKFNLYYLRESDSTVQMVTSKNQ